jgi:hypothetical protein
MGEMGPEEKIANAMSGGPASIAANATIMDWPSEPGGSLTELRAGTNGWTCLPDDPTTPTNDPICADPEWLAFLEAGMAGEEPTVDSIGIAYMLQGGSVADNDDPSIMEPAAGAEWQVDPPHIMILTPEGWDPAVYTTDHHSGNPWIMFGGTPAEHVMFPVEMVPVESEAGDDKIANALSAGPTWIREGAAVIDWPTEAGGEVSELRPGTNGWTCITDNPGSPTNDPMCLDAQWVEWLTAYLAGEEPEITAVGFAYMLQGGSDTNNADPTLTEPPAGGEWVISPPHVMILSPDPLNLSLHSDDHHSGSHWVMFGGTPYEHVMIPIAGLEHE